MLWRINGGCGSHIIITKTGTAVTPSIPNHSAVAKGTLWALLRNASLTVAEFYATL